MSFDINTNIWLDYFENRSDGLRPLGEFAFQFLRNAIESNSVIYCSDLVITELNNVLTKEVVDSRINAIKNNLTYVESTKEDCFFAKKIVSSFNIHFTDAFHAAIASRLGAVLITRDKHFDYLNFIEVKKPEEVLF
ncbi:MAG: type II toxin-antitoxin system VapC family toxin [Candidatus Iainarchaeum sp.]|jgi:predicted nucleic acid-binding protein